MTETEIAKWRDNLFAIALEFEHITADEVPGVMQRLAWKDGVAKVIAEGDAQDAKDILGINADIHAALVDYVKPRWPELF